MFHEFHNSEIQLHAYLDFLFTKGNTVDNEHSRCLIRFRVSFVLGFQYVLVLGAEGFNISSVDINSTHHLLPCTPTLLTDKRCIVYTWR